MKKIVAIILIAALIMCMTGCIRGNPQEPEKNTVYKKLLNSGGYIVYTFEDVETGVWYITTMEGVTPRLNSDGTLYVSEN